MPKPKLTFLVGGETVEADSQEERTESEHSAVLSLLLEEGHFNQPVLCTAHNRASPSPLSSNTVNINIKRRFSLVQIHSILCSDWLKSIHAHSYMKV